MKTARLITLLFFALGVMIGDVNSAGPVILDQYGGNFPGRWQGSGPIIIESQTPGISNARAYCFFGSAAVVATSTEVHAVNGVARGRVGKANVIIDGVKYPLKDGAAYIAQVMNVDYAHLIKRSLAACGG